MNHFVTVASLCLLACLAAGVDAFDLSAGESPEATFSRWMTSYEVEYASTQEQEQKFAVFSHNLAFVNEWNSKREDGRHTVVLNAFADLTGIEYKKYAATRAASATPQSAKPLKGAIVDWRTKNAVTPVLNEGQDDSAGAIAIVGAIEGCAAIASGNLIALSVDQIFECTTDEMIDMAWQWVVQQGGLDAAGAFQSCPGQKPWAATIKAYAHVKAGSEASLQAVVNVTTPAATIDASQSSFQFYDSGVYYEPACSSIQLDHEVLVVGYGTLSGQDYWIVKNCWGTDWGDEGYILMSRNHGNNCGIATYSTYATGCW